MLNGFANAPLETIHGTYSLRTSQIISGEYLNGFSCLGGGSSVWQCKTYQLGSWWNINLFWPNALFYCRWSRFVMNRVKRIIQHMLYDQLAVLPIVKTREMDWFSKYKSIHNRWLNESFSTTYTYVYTLTLYLIWHMNCWTSLTLITCR